jgi:replicative DNA helicase
MAREKRRRRSEKGHTLNPSSSSEPTATAPADPAAPRCEEAAPPACGPPPFYAFADLASAWLAEAEAARVACLSGKPRGPVTGFAKLDRELGGYLRPGLHFVHGEPGTGKTNYALQVAAACGAPALFVSCEMGRLVLASRTVARVTRTHLGKLDGGELSPASMADLFARAALACPMLALMDATRAYADPAVIRDRAELWREAHGAASCLVVIDSLHTWAAGKPCGDYLPSEYEAVNDALGSLQRMAADLAAPVLVVAERNRASMANPGQSSAKGSARIEYSAESVVSLNRDEDSAGEWRQDASGERHLFAKLAKNRNGDTGRKLEMRFSGALATIREA